MTDIDLDKSIASAELSLKQAKDKFGPDHLTVAEQLTNLAALLRQKKRILDAVNLEARATVIRDQIGLPYQAITKNRPATQKGLQSLTSVSCLSRDLLNTPLVSPTFVAGIVMGIVAGIVGYFSLTIFTGGGEQNHFGVAGILIGFLIALGLAQTARTVRRAWVKTLLFTGLLCYSLPLSAFAFTTIIGAQQIAATDSSALRAGAVLGIGIGGLVLSSQLFIIGFSLGTMMIVLAFYLLLTEEKS